MTERYDLVPVGRIRSAVKEIKDAPRQGREPGLEVDVEIDSAYLDALVGVEQHPFLKIVCWLHHADRKLLKVHPRGDRRNPLRGVFATRSAGRPNPLAVYTVEVLEAAGSTLRVRGVDAVDGTPVIDIRPHFPRLDN